VPTRDGYVFHGWFTDKTGDTHVTGFTVFESDATIYAQWTPIFYSGAVTYGDETYQTVVIGTQTWFARNLNYEVEGSMCNGQDGIVVVQHVVNGVASGYYDTLSNAEVQANCEKYGRLYNWDAAMSACPVGWHLPTNDEWETLINFVGGSSVAGWELRSSSDWEHQDDIAVGADDYGFSALPGGQGYIDNNLNVKFGVGGGFWWSSTDWVNTKNNALVWYTSYQVEWMKHTAYNKRTTFNSVRCVKD
jgi:uncharacterized protein (TIGR02145 family)/uncharacterized repeat protein (TIGR02543 family)